MKDQYFLGLNQLIVDSHYGPAVTRLLGQYQLAGEQITATGRNKKLLKGDVLKYIADNSLQPKPPKPGRQVGLSREGWETTLNYCYNVIFANQIQILNCLILCCLNEFISAYY